MASPATGTRIRDHEIAALVGQDGPSWDGEVGTRRGMMGFRFYRRFRIAPGLSVNLSRSGPSLTMGVRGAHVTVGRRGVTKTVGLPGTGLFYTSRQPLHPGYHSAATEAPVSTEQQLANARHVEVVLVILLVVAVLAIAFLASL
jgi:hypothetical protein